MANHQIPRRASRIETVHGVDADGNVVTCSVYQHTRQGHEHPMFYVVQYRERNRHIDRATRVTREFSGPRSRQRMDEAMTETRELLAASRVQAACGGAVTMTRWEGPDGLEVTVATTTGTRHRELRSWYLISRPDPDHPGGRLGERAGTIEELAARVDLATLREAA